MAPRVFKQRHVGAALVWTHHTCCLVPVLTLQHLLCWLRFSAHGSGFWPARRPSRVHREARGASQRRCYVGVDEDPEPKIKRCRTWKVRIKQAEVRTLKKKQDLRDAQIRKNQARKWGGMFREVGRKPGQNKIPKVRGEPGFTTLVCCDPSWELRFPGNLSTLE